MPTPRLLSSAAGAGFAALAASYGAVEFDDFAVHAAAGAGAIWMGFGCGDFIEFDRICGKMCRISCRIIRFCYQILHLPSYTSHTHSHPIPIEVINLHTWYTSGRTGSSKLLASLELGPATWELGAGSWEYFLLS
jgi:hypothetical protein